MGPLRGPPWAAAREGACACAKRMEVVPGFPLPRSKVVAYERKKGMPRMTIFPLFVDSSNSVNAGAHLGAHGPEQNVGFRTGAPRAFIRMAQRP